MWQFKPIVRHCPTIILLHCSYFQVHQPLTALMSHFLLTLKEPTSLRWPSTLREPEASPEVKNTERECCSPVAIILNSTSYFKPGTTLISQSLHHWLHEVIQETPSPSEEFQPNWPECPHLTVRYVSRVLVFLSGTETDLLYQSD